MIRTIYKLTALLDANVLYPAPVRDLLLRMASTGLYQPRWSEEIQQEWIRNLLINRRDISTENLEKTKQAMNKAFPDANVEGYEKLIPKLKLRDANDRHVLAAAIMAKVDLLVTNNIKDFQADYLSNYQIGIQNADEFIYNLIVLNPQYAIEAVNKQIAGLKNPPITHLTLLQTFEKCELIKSVSALKNCFSLK